MPFQTRTLVAALGLGLSTALPIRAQEAPMLGFTSESADEQRRLETLFDEQMNRDNLREWMERITAEPFFVGTPHNKENAEWVADLFRDWGYDTEIVEYQVLFPKPRIREVEMVAPERYRALLAEPVLEADATSGVDGRLPTYNAYSADGDVTGELVYVNYGTPDDYEELDRRGIDVRDKIRHRPVRGLVARDQAEGRPRARCAGYDSLLRSPGRRLLPGGCLPGWPLPHGSRSPAGLGHRHAALPG